MEILKEKYSITELSEILHVTDHALRFYEKEFGFYVPKDSRGRRYYTSDLANLMFKIKTMRDDGLELKAIRKILLSDESFREPPPVVTDEKTETLSRTGINSGNADIRAFFQEFREQLTADFSTEIATSKEQLAKEINQSKLELGACVENGMRRLEAKMERHFLDVDKALGVWREKNRKNVFKRMLTKTLK